MARINSKLSCMCFTVFTIFLCLGMDRPNAENYNLNLQFSDEDRIQESELKTHDVLKPLYFDLFHPMSHVSMLGLPFTADKGTEFRVWLDKIAPGDHILPTARSLGIKITSKKDQDVKDKIILSILPHDSQNHIDITATSTRHYISFAFMIDPYYEVSKFWVIHLQAWQCCGGHPPFTMSVTPNENPHGPVEFVFGIRDDDTESLMHDQKHVLYKMIVQRGIWNVITLELEPRADDDPRAGGVSMWLDGNQKFSYHGPWGYAPVDHAPDGHEIRKYLGLDLGIYRRRETTTQTIYFDDIEISTMNPPMNAAGQ